MSNPVRDRGKPGSATARNARVRGPNNTRCRSTPVVRTRLCAVADCREVADNDADRRGDSVSPAARLASDPPSVVSRYTSPTASIPVAASARASSARSWPSGSATSRSTAMVSSSSWMASSVVHQQLGTSCGRYGGRRIGGQSAGRPDRAQVETDETRPRRSRRGRSGTTARASSRSLALRRGSDGRWSSVRLRGRRRPRTSRQGCGPRSVPVFPISFILAR